MVGASATATPSSAQLVSAVDALLQELESIVSPGSSLSSEIVRASGSSITAQLRDHARQLTAIVRDAKQHSSEVRLSKDQAQLGLQNLLYERRHLEREIEKCRQFNSIYQDVPLQPLDEFLKAVPEEELTEDVLKDEHQLLLKRLNLELSERTRLDAQKKQMVAEKEKLLSENKKAESGLDTLMVELDGLSKVAGELQVKMAALELP